MQESFKKESYDRKLEDDLSDFLYKNKYSGLEIRETYYKLFGISDSTKDNKRITNLSKRMEEMSAQSFPINRFVKMIEKQNKFETVVDSYDNYISELNISDREKFILNSIVHKKRSGVLECHIGNVVVEKITIESNLPIQDAALALKHSSLRL